MKTTTIVLLCVLCAACTAPITMPVAYAPVPVTVDTRMLEVLPEGTGWVILDQASEDMEKMYALMRSHGYQIPQDLACRFDAETQNVGVRTSTHPPANLVLSAVNVELKGDLEAAAIRQGLPAKRTEVNLALNAFVQCGVAMFTGDRIDEHLARIFSAGKQIGVQLSCTNIAC